MKFTDPSYLQERIKIFPESVDVALEVAYIRRLSDEARVRLNLPRKSYK